MTQPKFAPIQIEDQVREAYRLQTPEPWVADRPADFRAGPVPVGRGFGTPGPDQGYALRLAHRFEHRLALVEGEAFEDAVAAGVAIALRRAAAFGRAPVIHDLELAFTLVGYLGDPPDDLVSWRVSRLRGMSHHHWDEREVAEAVPESTLRLTPAQAGEQLASWRELLGAAAGDEVRQLPV
jgi:hypothetical protein